MLACARRKASELGLGEDRARFECRAAESVGELSEGFDGAYSDFGALNCADLGAVGAGLARVLRRGAPVLVSLLGRWPLPEGLLRALSGRGAPRGEPCVSGIPVSARYYSSGETRAALGPDFVWRGGFALGVLVPGPDHDAWACRHPQSFGALAALEAIVHGWPLLRALGDHVVLDGVRR
jgi:hypothetical protein